MSWPKEYAPMVSSIPGSLSPVTTHSKVGTLAMIILPVNCKMPVAAVVREAFSLNGNKPKLKNIVIHLNLRLMH